MNSSNFGLARSAALLVLLCAPLACTSSPDNGGGSSDEGGSGGSGKGGSGGAKNGGAGGKTGQGGSGKGGAGGSQMGGSGGSAAGGSGSGGSGAGGSASGGSGAGGSGTGGSGTGGSGTGGSGMGGSGTGGSSMGGASGKGQPFGSHTFKYPAGAALPAGGQAALDSAVASYYDKWKAAYVKQGCGGYYVRSGGGTGADVGDEVSEGHGYGMVITPIMAGHDPDAQKVFDGMYAFFRKFPSSHSPDLMGWTVNVAGGCKFPTTPSDSATDGDLDIAFGLLLADKQWGSAGAINYLAEAKKVIAAIKQLEMNATSKTPLLGDWAPGDAKFGNATRPSDFMIDHFRAYGAATGDAFWMGAVDSIHSVVVIIQGKHSQLTGLLPDFVINTTTSPAPAPAGFLEEATDGAYGYNSCRTPWRLVTDWVASGDPRAKAAVDKMVGWIRTKTGGDPSKVVDGYSLAGAALPNTSNDFSFEAPFSAAGIADKANQAWVDAGWNRMAAGSVDSYYTDSIKLLSMIVMSGNWWAP